MTDLTNKGNPDCPENIQSEKLSNEIISTTTPDTINLIQEPQNMDIHHHANHEHGKKNWKSYFWDFLMLFFAVFCGFLAENQREHYVERQREKQFMITLVEDIKEDSKNLKYGIDGFALINRQIDSIIPLLKDDIKLEENARQIYKHAVWLHAYFKITYSDRTIEQLKNSGNFRLIQNKTVSRKVLEYDGIMRNNIENMQNEYVYQSKEKMLDLSNGILRTSVIRKWLEGGWVYHDIEYLSDPYFLTIDKSKIDRFINQLDQYSLAIAWFEMSLKIAESKSGELESLITKEYHLE